MSDSSSYGISSDDDGVDAQALQLKTVDIQTNTYIKNYLNETLTNFRKMKEREKIPVMHGRSLYGFPTIEALET